ncbi:MAG: aminoacyl-tRNA hydrolase [Trueperaceae bacterium]|nr:aminoacyl-tRNA hydrolase [Trueperaceae bacterium]
MSSTPIKLIVGLGNPGARYVETRHNAGFLVVDELAKNWNSSFRSKTFSFSKTLAEEAKTEPLLIKPLTFMNLSGQAVQAYQTKLKLKPEQILVIHDDLDLPLGKLRFKAGGGGAGGQNGIKDIIRRIGPDFIRLKIGIDRPPQEWKVENWVLSKFKPEEKELIHKVIHNATKAVDKLLIEGLEPTMAEYNRLDLR